MHSGHHQFEQATVRHIAYTLANFLSLARQHFPVPVQLLLDGLADSGVLRVRRGEGTYVAPEPPAMAADERRRKLQVAARRYANTAKTLSADRDESLTAVREALAELERPAREAEA